MKNVKKLDIAVLTIMIAIYSIILYIILNLYVNFPYNALGNDAVPHIAKVSILKYWGLEGFRWLPTYYFGNPHFIFYTPATYAIPLAIYVVFGLSLEGITQLFNWMSFISIILTIIFVIVLIYIKNGRRLAPAVVSGLFLGTSPAIFEPWLFGGNYAELLSLPSIPLGLIFLDRYLEENSLKYSILYIIVSAYSITGHQAIGLFFVVFSIVWILLHGIPSRKNIARISILIIIIFGLTAWYIIPLAHMELSHKVRETLWMVMPSRLNLGDFVTTFLNIEIKELPSEGYRIPGFNFLTILIVLLIYRVFHKKASKNKFTYKTFIIMLIPSILLLYFILCTVFYIPFPAGYHPSRFVPIIVLSLSLSIGLILSTTSSKSAYTITCVIIITGLFIFMLFPPAYRVVSVGLLSADEKDRMSIISKDSTAGNDYRIGGVRDELFYWAQLYYPNLYTSRGYYAQGILYIDWQAWFEHSLAGAPPTIPWKNTILHLLDWSAVRYVGLLKNDTAAVLLSRNKLMPLTPFLNLTIYEYTDSPPISEVLLKGGVLFFGDYEGYDTVLRSIASSSYTKPAPVIVWAEGKCIDDVSSNVLESFSSIILYRYCYRDREKAFNLLKEYVYKGGRLFIETMSSTDESSNMPPPIPVAKTYRGEVSGSWTLEIREHILTANITENMFSPPVYDGGPWGVSYSTQGDLRDYAMPLLISNGKILTAYSRYGSGEVIWSGMNLPYHSLAYQNPNEADFMRRLIMGDVKPITLPTEMIRKSATSIIFKNVPEAKGIIFRERYISNLVFSWKAYDREGGLNVFMMGPGFNYIVLREGWSRGDVEMVLEDGPLRIASIAISLITVIILTLTLIRAHYRSKIRRSKHADLPLA
jgi:hypothetical protein